jgi:CheY-like chemotaxis protein
VNVPFKYDVFISHSSSDKPIVIDLARKLTADGLRVWLDKWIIKPGDIIGQSIEEGLQNSRTLVLLMSKAAFASDWVALERHTLLFRDPTNRNRRFIPVLIEDCQIPDLIAQFAYVDWRKQSRSSYENLLFACRQKWKQKTKTRRVLIVDDRKAFRKHLAELLTLHNYKIFRAISGKHALSKLTKVAADVGLVLMDIQMPGKLDGIETAIRIQNSYPNLPIMFISGYGDNRIYQKRVYDSGISIAGWVDKPLTGKSLRKLMNMIDIILTKDF